MRQVWSEKGGVIGAFGAVLLGLCCILARSGEQTMLADSDTVALLRGLAERKNPWSWFAGDWPLQNHFYRPFPTLTFEWDLARYGSNAAGYGLTNAILAAMVILGVYLFGLALSGRPGLALFCAGLFTAWTLSWIPYGLPTSILIALTAGGFHAWRRRRLAWESLGLAAIGYYAGYELMPMTGLYSRMIAWLPGRTASVMAIFAMLSLAAFAAYLRRGQARYLGLALLMCAAALGSYEQAVMLPACLLGVSVVMAWQGIAPRWRAHVGFWILLLLYLVLRARLIPTAPSGYQAQQYRDGPGVILSLVAHAVPGGGIWTSLVAWNGAGLALLFMGQVYRETSLAATNLWSLRAIWMSRHTNLALAGLIWSFLAFLPMAWLKQFEHYDYWPMAMRTFLVTGLFGLLFDLTKKTPGIFPIPGDNSLEGSQR